MVQVTATGDQFTHHREELFLHGAAQATVGQLVDAAIGFFFGATDRTLLEDFTVNAQLAELVDDHRNATALGVVEHMAQQRGFARAKEAGNDGDGKFGQCFHRMPFGAGIRDDRPCGGAQQRISSPDHPARLNWKIGCEAGLLAWGVQVLRPTLTAPSRPIGSGVAVN